MRLKANWSYRQSNILGRIGIGLLASTLLMAMFLTVLGSGVSPASADAPSASSPVSGAATAQPFGDAPISSSTPPEEDADLESTNGSASKTKTYTRFEINQKALQSLSGILSVTGEGFGQKVPYEAAPGERFSAYVLFPERTGPYRLELSSVGRNDPVLWVTGNLQRIGPAEYRHQLLNGDADPGLLALAAEDVGVIIALGSVKAKLNSCVDLYSPVNAVFELGVDTDGDGRIDPGETVTRAIENESSACVETPESNIPLTSLYKSRVSTSQGTVIAQNKGLYDFLDKSSVHSEKVSQADLVREFKVKWIRTPMASSIEIKNSSLREPSVDVKVVPQVEEVTSDIIRNGSGASATPSDPSGSEGDSSSADARGNDAIPFGFIKGNWMLLALGAGLAIALLLIIRGVRSTDILPHSNR